MVGLEAPDAGLCGDSPLHRLVTIVARGTLTSDEVRGTAQRLAKARIRRFAKIVEVAGHTSTSSPQTLRISRRPCAATRTVADRSPLSSPPTEVPSLVNSPRSPHMR